MSKALPLTCLLALVLAFCACRDRLPTTINIDIDNENSAGGPTANPAPGTLGQCSPAEETPVRVNIDAPSQLAVGATALLDATPKTATGPRSDACNVFQGISWNTQPPDVCSVSDPTDFTPNLRGLAVGTCVLTATVPTKGVSGSVNVPIVAP